MTFHVKLYLDNEIGKEIRRNKEKLGRISWENYFILLYKKSKGGKEI